MAIDLSKVKSKLKDLNSKNERVNHTWKPEPGTQIIRIVPYKFNPDFPFIELLFDYEVTKRSVLSPLTYGRPDPIDEFAKKLKAAGSSDDYKLGKKIEPKERFYAPVIVREQETEGVKLWGFGKTVYAELLKYISDPDYGDITDLENGRDITVEFKTAEESGKSYPTTEIRVKPNTSIAGDNNVLTAIQNQIKIEDVYKEPTYEELDALLQTYLNPEEKAAEEGNNTSTPTPTSDVKTTPDANTATSAKDLNDKFAALFDKNKSK